MCLLGAVAVSSYFLTADPKGVVDVASIQVWVSVDIAELCEFIILYHVHVNAPLDSLAVPDVMLTRTKTLLLSTSTSQPASEPVLSFIQGCLPKPIMPYPRFSPFSRPYASVQLEHKSTLPLGQCVVQKPTRCKFTTYLSGSIRFQAGMQSKRLHHVNPPVFQTAISLMGTCRIREASICNEVQRICETRASFCSLLPQLPSLVLVLTSYDNYKVAMKLPVPVTGVRLWYTRAFCIFFRFHLPKTFCPNIPSD